MSEYIMECKTVQTGVFKTLVEALKDMPSVRLDESDIEDEEAGDK